MPIRAILFDAAGTLIHLPRGVGWHYREVAARHGLDIEESRLATAFAAAFKAASPRVSPGAARDPRISHPADDKLWWRALVRQVLASCGHQPPPSIYDPLFEELYAHFAQPGVWALYPEVPAVLATLHPRYQLGIVSNFDRRLYPILENLGIRHYFQAIVISSELGLDKPDPRLFQAALDALGVLPSETLHAGDDPVQDWQAAESAGLHPFHVHRPIQTLESLPDYALSLP